MKETFGRDPLECSECKNCMEFRGIAVRKEDRLKVQFANSQEAKRYIRGEIEKIESQIYEDKKKEATGKAIEEYWFSWDKLKKETEANQRGIYLQGM